MAKFMVAFDVSKDYLGNERHYRKYKEEQVSEIRDNINNILINFLNGLKVCETTFIILTNSISNAQSLIDHVLDDFADDKDGTPVFSDEDKEHIRMTVVEFGSVIGNGGYDRGISSRYPIDNKESIYKLAGRVGY